MFDFQFKRLLPCIGAAVNTSNLKSQNTSNSFGACKQTKNHMRFLWRNCPILSQLNKFEKSIACCFCIQICRVFAEIDGLQCPMSSNRENTSVVTAVENLLKRNSRALILRAHFPFLWICGCSVAIAVAGVVVVVQPSHFIWIGIRVAAFQ